MMKRPVRMCACAVAAGLLFAGPLRAEVYTGNMAVRTVDADSDGQFDELAVDMELDVPARAENYVIRGYLCAETGGLDGGIPYSAYNVALSPGKQKITLRFDGYDIYRAKLNGAFVVRDFYFGRYTSVPRDDYQTICSTARIDLQHRYANTDFEQPDRRFRGATALFELPVGRSARIVEGDIGSMVVKAVSAGGERVLLAVSSSGREIRQRLRAGGELSLQTGGLEQTGRLRVDEIRGDVVTLSVTFGAAPPAPAIAGDMPVDIIYYN